MVIQINFTYSDVKRLSTVNIDSHLLNLIATIHWTMEVCITVCCKLPSYGILHGSDMK